MNTEKTVGMSFRVTPRTKLLLVAAAASERRSLTNMLEVLVEDFCARNGIIEEKTTPSKAGSNSERRTRR